MCHNQFINAVYIHCFIYEHNNDVCTAIYCKKRKKMKNYVGLNNKNELLNSLISSFLLQMGNSARFLTFSKLIFTFGNFMNYTEKNSILYRRKKSSEL